MVGCRQDDRYTSTAPTYVPGWRVSLWVALCISVVMFLAEILAGLAAGSASLQAGALDFLGDAASFAISLAVTGLALIWRARAALAKGVTIILLALWVVISTAWHAWFRILPEAEPMGAVAVAGVIANGTVALMLYRYRIGDANMRSVWICSCNDAIGNLAVLLAAAGVFGMGASWPDIMVAAIIALLGLSGGWVIVREASEELRSGAAYPLHARYRLFQGAVGVDRRADPPRREHHQRRADHVPSQGRVL